jgi:hypothetical protein
MRSRVSFALRLLTCGAAGLFTQALLNHSFGVEPTAACFGGVLFAVLIAICWMGGDFEWE